MPLASAGVQSTVGFNYRNAPAVSAARELIASGELGSITHARFRLFSDYAAHPEGALSWRFERERGGNGVLGDLASHGVDLARYLLGDIDVAGLGHRDVPHRARPPDRCHQRACAGNRRRAGSGGERGLCLQPAAFRLRCQGHAGGQPGRRRRAEQLRLRDPRHERRRPVGLPPDGGTRRQRRYRLPGPAGQHDVRRTDPQASTAPSSPARRAA